MTTTTCPSSGALRTHLAEPDPALEAHLDACRACRGVATALASDAGAVAAALRQLDEEVVVDVDAALGRLDPTPATPRAVATRRPLWRRPLTAAAALVVTFAVVLTTPGAREAVAQLLDVFRPARVQVVPVDLADPFAGLEQLGSIAQVDTSGLAEPTQAGNTTTIPGGVVTVTFADSPTVDVPSELEGAVLRVIVPAATMTVEGDPESPELVVGRAGALEVHAEGAPLADIRAFLLSREELPQSLRDQLAAIQDWRHTLPIPVPVDDVVWREIEVAGRPALAFGDDTGLGAAVLRLEADGSIVAVAGRRPLSELLRLAEEL